MDIQVAQTAKATLHEAMGRILSEIRSAWRFRWYGATFAWVAFLLGWGWVAIQPNIYEATARVYVDASSVLRPVLNNQIVPVDVATHLAFVRQSLLGRTHLERVARENGLDTEARTPAELDRVINILRQAIVTSSRENTNTVHTIAYRNSNRDTAIGVVTTLLNSLVENTIGANQEGSATASRFLDARIAEYEQRLQEAESALAEFKKRNSNRLPGNTGGYFERMRAASEGLDQAEKALRLAESRREQLQAQLVSESPVMPVGVASATQPPPNSIDARIQDYRAQLDALLLEYTERHPDVTNIRETLARLEEQRGEQLRNLGVTNTDQNLSSLDTNPVYQALRIALNQAEVEIASLQADVRERQADVDRLQGLIDEVPDVEAELARLNRDYNVVYEQYQGIVRSRETQELSQKALTADEVEFRVIDPPLAAYDPVAPKRALMIAGVFVVALAGGGALCWLLAQLSPVFSSTTVLRRVCGLPVLGSVSEAASDRRKIRRRMALLAFSGAVGSLAMLFTGALYLEVAGRGIHALLGLA